MSGEVEFGKCDVCHIEKPLERKYYYYAINCECHSPKHFELVRHCKDCIPNKPLLTNLTIKSEILNTKEEEKKNWISVEDRLPDNLSYHLVAWCVDEVTGVSIANYDAYVEKKWYKLHDSTFPIQMGNITHWMPFPNPPKNSRIK